MFRYTLLFSDFILSIIKMFAKKSEKLKSSLTKSSQLLISTVTYQTISETLKNNCQDDGSEESQKTVTSTDDNSSRKLKKSVDFSKVVRVCLIPCRSEFEPVKSYLWWTSIEINCFKGEAFQELKKVIANHHCTLKEGLAILYNNSEDSIHQNIK